MTGPPHSSSAKANVVPQPGDVLASKYRVESVLGAGGMGVVFLVEHIELGQRMAIKIMTPSAVEDTRAAARFLREARAAAGLESEHVVRIFDVGTLESGVPFMVMELLRGEDLSRVLQSAGRGLPISQAADYVLQACHAIAEAHALGIVHRDLKPSNLFLTHRSDGTPLIKVLDFGISKALTDSLTGEPPGSLTATSAVMGSPLYMSPEQVRNTRQVDARTDVWSLGVILHELLTGAPAFMADTVPGICAAIAADEPPLLRALRADMPAELESIVSRCLEKSVSKRFQSVSELMAALRLFAPATSRGQARLVMAKTMPEAGSSSKNPSRPIESGVSRRAGRAIVSISPQELAATERPESTRAGAMSGGAVALSAPESAPRTEPRYRFVLVSAGIVFLGVAAGWTLASMRQERTSPQPAPVASVLVGDRVERRESFVLVIDSEPQGASVMEGSQRIGATPARISVDNAVARASPRQLSIERDGFLPYSIVQGPSDQDVHVVAVLERRPPRPGGASAGGAGAPAIAPAPRLLKPKSAAPLASADPIVASSALPPSVRPPVSSGPDDIRPQR